MNLCKTLGGPVINKIAEDPEGLDGDMNSLIIVAVSVAVQELDEEVSDPILDAVFNGVSFVGEGPTGFALKLWDKDFNSHFHGRLASVYKVWAWSVQVNYRDFLDALPGLGEGKAKDLGREVLSSLRTSTSRSGQSYSATR